MNGNGCEWAERRPGGNIERGKIISAELSGYRIVSFDREGIETPPLKPIDDKIYAAGDAVIFVYFNDGTGKILCGM